MSNEKNYNGKRAALIVLCVVLGIFLSVLVAGTIYANHLMNQLNRVEKGKEETLSQDQLDQLLADEIIGDAGSSDINEGEIDWGNSTIIEGSENIVNILLIGQDARAGWGRSRSDSMILVTFNKADKTITLTSFLRDLYVQIPGYTDNKLNAAYPAGGMTLLNQALEVNFGVQVDGNIEVDFSHFSDVIDLLGGVDLELRHDEAMTINRAMNNSQLEQGMMHLNGAQALEYSRIRYLDNDADFSRTNRQRKVINALIEKFRNTELATLLGILDDLLPMITTDMTNAEIIGYATELFPMLAGCSIVSQRIPADNAYSLATIRGMSCVVADMEAARQLLKETLSE